MKNYTKFTNGLHKGLVFIQAILLVALLVMVTIQVATRLMPFLPHVLWTEEIARFLLVWIVFLGGSIGVKEASHFTVSLLPEAKSKAIELFWETGVQLLMMVLVVIFTYRGFKYAKVMVWDISDIAQVSMVWVGAAIPAFGILSLLFLINNIISNFTKGRE